MADVIQRALLADAAKRIRLMPATSRLLCHDDDGFQVPSAATVFKGRPPSLTSDQAVATFLGIDVDLYWKLLAMTGQWPLGAGGMGADMDQVLKLQRELAAVMPLSQVDALLGGPAGLAEELVRADLLLIFKSDDRVLGVHPAGLLHLLGGIHGRIHPQPDANSVALVSVQAIREDALFAAKAIARIHGGSLGALGWQSPFRLLDVLVDGSQLQMEVLAP